MRITITKYGKFLGKEEFDEHLEEVKATPEKFLFSDKAYEAIRNWEPDQPEVELPNDPCADSENCKGISKIIIFN
jgi:hypothetical protein